MEIRTVTLSVMQTPEKPHPTKRLFLAASVLVFAVLSGGGLVYAAGRDLADWNNPITDLLFIVGGIMSTLMVLTGSEARRRGDDSLRVKLALLVVAVAICDGRFVSHFVLRGQGVVAAATVPTAGLQKDSDAITADIAAREARIADLEQSAAEARSLADREGETGKGPRYAALAGAADVKESILNAAKSELADRRHDLIEAQDRLHAAEGRSAGVNYEVDPILQLTAGLTERQRLLAVWGVFALLFWLVESTLLDNARGVRILSNEPESTSIPSPTPPDGGLPTAKLNGQGVAVQTQEPMIANQQKGLRYRNDGRRKRAIHERRIRGTLHTIPLPANATPEELRQTAAAVNRAIDSALASKSEEIVIPFRQVA